MRVDKDVKFHDTKRVFHRICYNVTEEDFLKKIMEFVKHTIYVCTFVPDDT